MKGPNALALAAATGAALVHGAALDLVHRQSHDGDGGLEKRQVSTDGRCGTGFGNTVCSSTECCSSAG